MGKAKKIGIVLILIGLCLPIVSFAFVSEYYLRGGSTISDFLFLIPRMRMGCPGGGPRGVIPYRYIFAFGVVLVFTGIGFIALSKREDSKQ